jgi:hypothetical protein
VGTVDNGRTCGLLGYYAAGVVSGFNSGIKEATAYSFILMFLVTATRHVYYLTVESKLFWFFCRSPFVFDIHSSRLWQQVDVPRHHAGYVRYIRKYSPPVDPFLRFSNV